jgi:1-acyl-sn-glycerol-3-phosphate acyltransferase
MILVPAQYEHATCGIEPMLGPLPQRNLPMLSGRILPALRALIRTGYFRLEVVGSEHVPRTGPAIYVGNHAGWFTLDTLMGALVVSDFIATDRLPWGAVHDQVLQLPRLGPFFQAVGGFPASWMRTPERIPPQMQVFSIYPEGTAGNCKSFIHAYKMRPWRTGFVRMAIARRASIVPVAIIGGEECLPSLATIDALKPLLGTSVPVPLAFIPLPTRWKFIFHKPISLNEQYLGGERDLDRLKPRLREIADDVREAVQKTIDQETTGRVLVRLSKVISSAWRTPHTPLNSELASNRCVSQSVFA